MSALHTLLVVLKSALVALVLLALGMADAQGDFEPAQPSSLFSFNKLKESLGGINWGSYFGDSGGKVMDTSTSTNSENENFLDPNGTDVQFILFTRRNPPHNMKMKVHSDFLASGFNRSHPTKIIIHGFLSSTKEDVFVINRNAYMETGDYNVIGMDWSALCEFEYFTAMRGAQIAGAALGAFVNWLVDEGVRHEDIHLVGHSLGAHVAAMGADKVKSGKLSRITGLDPAGPGYNKEVPQMYRLDPTDAALVDVIHTNIRVLSLPNPQGHLDFYPNGGRIQPGCPNMYDIWTFGDSMECNHGRAYYYFAESIRNRYAFKSYRCPNVENANLEHCIIETNVYMGQADTYEILDCATTRVDITFKPGDWQVAVRRCNEANVSWYGLYYLKTNDRSPFSLS